MMCHASYLPLNRKPTTLVIFLSVGFTILLPFIFFYFWFTPEERPYGFNELEAAQRHALSGFCLLLGILFSQAYKALGVEPSLSLKGVFYYIFSRQLVRSLLASPVLFLANYLITQQITDLITGSLLAFETGFFCDVVLSKRRQERI